MWSVCFWLSKAVLACKVRQKAIVTALAMTPTTLQRCQQHRNLPKTPCKEATWFLVVPLGFSGIVWLGRSCAFGALSFYPLSNASKETIFFQPIANTYFRMLLLVFLKWSHSFLRFWFWCCTASSYCLSEVASRSDAFFMSIRWRSSVKSSVNAESLSS